MIVREVLTSSICIEDMLLDFNLYPRMQPFQLLPELKRTYKH